MSEKEIELDFRRDITATDGENHQKAPHPQQQQQQQQHGQQHGQERQHGGAKYGNERASPQQDFFFVLWFKQLYFWTRTNFILIFLRGWKSTLATILVPIIFLIALKVIQQMSLSDGYPQDLHPLTHPLNGVIPCTPGATTPCFTVLFAPDTSATREIMRLFFANNNPRINSDLPFSVVQLTDFEPPKQSNFLASAPSSHFVSDFILRYPNHTTWAVTFDIDVPKFGYQIWFNQTLTFNSTQQVDDFFAFYVTEMMRGVEEAIIAYSLETLGQEPVKLDVSLKSWPVYVSNTLAQTIIANAGPIFFFCSSMVNFMIVLNTLVQEKELKLRHGMQVMGLMPSVYWTSHLLLNMIIVILSSVVTCGFGVAFGFSFFTNTDFSVLMLLFFMFSFSMVFFAFFLSSFVVRSRTATMVGIFMLIIGLVFMYLCFTDPNVGYIWWEEKTSPVGWIILMFFPPFNFGKLFFDISLLAVGATDWSTDAVIPGPGFRWSNLAHVIPFKYLPTNGNYHVPPPLQSVQFLVMNMFFYGIMSWYLDNVIPDEYGNSKPYHFFLLPTYWGITIGRHEPPRYNLDAMLKRAEAEMEDGDVHQERLKALDDAQSRLSAVRLMYLRKEYRPFFARSSKAKVAVDGSCWTLQEGRLLALLGQNGAGKSSTISMLCGFSKPTSGHAFIFGRSILTDMEEIRSFMGVCPQHDVLFNDLTAMEHMRLFAGIKNIPWDKIQTLAEDRLGAVRLLRVKNTKAGSYSGGMKRRLSVAISTLGDPRVIFMDEPTTGMDPVNRRHVWSFLENFKAGRAIILTTHSMEEADILGDEVAIMALGRVRAFGSATHLKGKFGAGYRVSLVCDPEHVFSVKNFMKEQVPASVLEDDSAGALAYQIPTSSSSILGDLVRKLEQKELQGVRDWGISQSTLEDVFLKIIREVNPTSRPEQNDANFDM